jgi:hypothetical protein
MFHATAPGREESACEPWNRSLVAPASRRHFCAASKIEKTAGKMPAPQRQMFRIK